MAHQQPQQIISIDLLVPPNKQYDVAEAKKKIVLINPTCPPSSRILGDILRQHPLCFSLIASALVPCIYIQQVWHTLKQDDLEDKFKFFIDTKEFMFSIDDFRRVDQPSIQIIRMLYCFRNNVHVDYAALVWEGLYYSYLHPIAVIPYPRKKKEQLGMRILEWTLTEEMKQAKHYKLYDVEIGIDVPMTKS
ncbi:hypothetical protein Tco_1209622 [Tanacetum coccineum]